MTGGRSQPIAERSQLRSCVSEIAFLVGSPHRVRILRALYDQDGCTRGELRALVDASRTTVQRNVQALEERGWITNASVEYAITPAGALVTEELLGLVETMQLATDLRDVLCWLPRAELGFDLRELNDATITVATPTNPYAPVNRLADTLETAGQLRGIFSAATLATLDIAHARVAVDGVDWSIVLAATVHEALESSPAYAERFDDLLAADRFDLYAYPDGVPFYLGIFDDELQLGIENGDGVLKALVQSTSATVREWGAKVFTDYRARSTPL